MPAPYGYLSPINVAAYLVSTLDGAISQVFYGVFQFDVTNFNDANSPSFYFWKVEEIIAGRTPTCNRQMITYRDLGVVTATFTLSGYDQSAQTPVLQQSTQTLGTVAATQKLCTLLLGMTLTAQNLQFSVARAANAGPLSIARVRLEGEVERTAYA
jgi:hypothetical protein